MSRRPSQQGGGLLTSYTIDMEWISVEDRMPPPMTLVLALVQYDTTPIIAERRPFKGGPEIWWATCPEYGEINGDAFWYGGFEGTATMVTHWMPLPEAPILSKSDPA